MELTVAGIALLATSIHPLHEFNLKRTVFPEASYFWGDHGFLFGGHVSTQAAWKDVQELEMGSIGPLS